MEKSIEEKFVKAFIERGKRDRVLFELNSKKREQAVLRLSAYIDQRYIVFASNKITDEEIELQLLKKTKAKDSVYILSDDSYDGQKLEFSKAFDNALHSCGTYIIVINENNVFMKDEVEIGSPKKYFLSRDSLDATKG
jgi:5S rRNA maturation endonuclease (ribonuclease M5)